MDKQGTKVMINFIVDSLTLRVDINDATVTNYTKALSRYSPTVVQAVVSELCAQWDKRYLPPAAIIADLCSHKQEDTGGGDDFCQKKREREEQEYQAMKDTYKRETFEFREAILNDKPLTEIQSAAKAQIDIYIGYSFGERDLKEEFNKGRTPFTICYFAHFREFLAGTLPELTGIPQGNVTITSKPKSYGEEYFKGFNFGKI